MKKNPLIYFIIAPLFLTITVLSACSRNGADTGNSHEESITECESGVNGADNYTTENAGIEETYETETLEPSESSESSQPTESSESSQPTESSEFDVSSLPAAALYNQLIIVSSSGTTATVTMYTKTENGWATILTTTGFVGEEGVGTCSEYSGRTPRGLYTLGTAFGIKDNPDTTRNYTKVDDTYYWVDDVNSSYYNKFVTTRDVPASNWNSAEHIIDYPDSYNYVLSINYNTDCIPGMGSAIFLHCSNGMPTSGCVSVPEDDMITILKNIQADCAILIE
ncbi:MAG: L,D-transpeptidase [Lachnospira sp.]